MSPLSGRLRNQYTKTVQQRYPSIRKLSHSNDILTKVNPNFHKHMVDDSITPRTRRIDYIHDPFKGAKPRIPKVTDIATLRYY
jgi:hypothetical protein